MKRFCFVLCLSLTACSAGAPPSTGAIAEGSNAQPELAEGLTRRTLSNGMSVLVRDVPESSVASVLLYVRSGYFHEDDDEAGISHLIEHLLTAGGGEGSFDQQVQAMGGVFGAATIYDRTTYGAVVPNQEAEAAVEMFASALQDPSFSDDDLARERLAVFREAERKRANPQTLGRESLHSLIYPSHRMGRWRLGNEQQLGSLTLADVEAYYRGHYLPPNFILTVVGDVDSEALGDRIEQLFEGMPRGELRQRRGPSEPGQSQTRYERVSLDISGNYVFVGFPTEGAQGGDVPTLDVLAHLLADGRTSRLVSTLREETPLLYDVGARSYQFDDIGVFEINAQSYSEEIDKVLRGIFVQIEGLKQFDIEPEELDAARRRIELQRWDRFQTVQGQAHMLARAEAEGSVDRADRYLNRLAAITPEDIRQAANDYLRIERASIFEYLSLEVLSDVLTPEQMQDHLEGAMLSAAFDLYPPAPPTKGFSYLTQDSLVVWNQRFAAGQAGGSSLQRFEFENGAVLLVAEDPGVPVVSANVTFRGGRLNEVTNNAGLTLLCQRLMSKETQNRDERQLAYDIEGLGARLNLITNDDYYGFETFTTRDLLASAFDVLFDVVTNPRFDSAQIVREKRPMMQQTQAVRDFGGVYADQLARAAQFPDHPYGFPKLGSATFIKYSGSERFEDFHAELANPQNAVITVVGDVDASTVRNYVAEYMGDWDNVTDLYPAGAAAFYNADVVDPVTSLTEPARAEVAQDRRQAVVQLSYETVGTTHPDRAALELVSALSRVPTDALFAQLQASGTAFGLTAEQRSRAMGGYISCRAMCAPDQVEQVESAMKESLQSLAETGASAASLDAARRYLEGRHQLRWQDRRARGRILAERELLGIPLEVEPTWNGVDAEAVQRVAAEYFVDRPSAVGVVQGNQSDPGISEDPGS